MTKKSLQTTLEKLPTDDILALTDALYDQAKKEMAAGSRPTKKQIAILNRARRALQDYRGQK